MAAKAYQHPDLKNVSFSQVMQALSDPCRISIMQALIREQELACNELPSDVAKATLSHHVGVLRDAGLITTRVEGTKCLNSVRHEAFNDYFPGLLNLIQNSHH
ncbi:metalloregulator ArsR/SmtB family transcription factor [Coraliomargarita sp. SDUM461004]|uniref:Metalloregulator ArsR/SmtB family transcription factor n=1 Tax=Thalassobacterium sedimentorum TaxID=3041258 RepID=A0ABU1ANZ0_9BACT|nr:metalloregulator ArsR/SmtB family transcription factor [Coraliomargarita sp. SDUM461004]MDQ8195486.1 metalloregulator ArsR/SmtB family transcription factor [Coraliomargarita sp. SDUM461004]